MSSMLGAQLGDLESLSSQLRSTMSEIGAVQGESMATSNTVVSSVREAATRAQGEILAAMERLRASVETSATQANAAAWTGANRDSFVSSYGEFQSAMTAAEAATEDAYQQFTTQIDAMAASLEDYTAQLQSSLTQAEASTESMSGAVDAQRTNLDQVMNTGMSIG